MLSNVITWLCSGRKDKAHGTLLSCLLSMEKFKTHLEENMNLKTKTKHLDPI